MSKDMGASFGPGSREPEPKEVPAASGFDPSRLALVLDPVAEAIHASIFEEPLGPDGTIERALYRQAAEAGLRAGVAVFRAAPPRCEYCGDSGDIHRIDGEWLGVCDCPAGDAIRSGRENAALFEQGRQRIEELRQTRDRLIAVLRECEEYFDQRADAECFPDSPSYVGNEEMKLLVEIQEELRRAK